jgi:hypothetical protein
MRSPLPADLQLLKFKHLDLLQRFYRGEIEVSGNRDLKNALAWISCGNQGVKNDQRLKDAVSEFFSALEERAQMPLIWTIGGGQILLQEFIMPILPALYSAVQISGTRKVEFRTEGFSFKQADLYKAINDGAVQFALFNGRGLDHNPQEIHSRTPYRSYRFDSERNEVHPINGEGKEDESDGIGNESNSILARLDLGAFDYKIYMQEDLFRKNMDAHSKDNDWWKKLPLVIAERHCPCGLRTLEQIAEQEGANIAHICPDITSALAAINYKDSPYASILPSYLKDLKGLKSYGISCTWEKKIRGVEYAIEELTGHFVSVRWKPNSVKACSKDGEPEKIDKSTKSGAALITILSSLIEHINRNEASD